MCWSNGVYGWQCLYQHVLITVYLPHYAADTQHILDEIASPDTTIPTSTTGHCVNGYPFKIISTLMTINKMKLSITLLSSILAICSVTVASPILPSSDAAIEFGSADHPNPYSEYMADCYPITLDGIVTIKNYADGKRNFDRKMKPFNLKTIQIENQKEAMSKLNAKMEFLATQVGNTRGPSVYESEFLKLKPKHFEERSILEKLEKSLEELEPDYLKAKDGLDKLKSKFYYYLTRHDTTGVMAAATPNLDLYPGLKKCFSIFYNDLS
ncbi:hypothetical protein BATDEDRAFT_24867 [Batrachochytrium dendrobatidis JAM81]|uniref:Uncharacterized protein n=1 Tax=Batrachochytrium dendrobatidis (strain JAM81 / FGSC 10211) TaxID=684364 RepID=F4P395_BATDJ|nr:uncharacterized protein BATDEDRAFT_24867 [Batrachochytrium dendrobatidis JAM81]EGF80361.1 hypothetical protein BATDEDRAFT_24867 [Batrachochytrium dendrobatidis JAM81]|eukprot:XP_006678950.1 hypothetical protein BATDEDRAFT_24867 [Batrachochytrium dendrobatidis JAM81]